MVFLNLILQALVAVLELPIRLSKDLAAAAVSDRRVALSKALEGPLVAVACLKVDSAAVARHRLGLVHRLLGLGLEEVVVLEVVVALVLAAVVLGPLVVVVLAPRLHLAVLGRWVVEAVALVLAQARARVEVEVDLRAALVALVVVVSAAVQDLDKAAEEDLDLGEAEAAVALVLLVVVVERVPEQVGEDLEEEQEEDLEAEADLARLNNNSKAGLVQEAVGLEVEGLVFHQVVRDSVVGVVSKSSDR